MKKNKNLISFYDQSDIREQAERAYDKDMPSDEIKRRRKKDWLTIIIGVPLFILFICLIAYAYKALQ